MKGAGILVVLVVPLLPILLISQDHHIFLSTLTRCLPTIGLAPWERLLLPDVDPYHRQFLALAFLMSLILASAAVYKVVFSRESVIKNLEMYREMYGNRSSIIAYDGDKPKVVRAWLLGSTATYILRIISIYLMSFDVVGSINKSKNIIVLLSPEMVVVSTIMTFVGASMAVCRIWIDFPIDTQSQSYNNPLY